MSTQVTQIVTNPLSGQTSTGTGSTYQNVKNIPMGYQATVTGTGAVSATVKVWGANSDVASDNTKAVLLGTISLSGTTNASDGFYSFAGWSYVFGEVTAISGTGAAVTLTQRM